MEKEFADIYVEDILRRIKGKLASDFPDQIGKTDKTDEKMRKVIKQTLGFPSESNNVPTINPPKLFPSPNENENRTILNLLSYYYVAIQFNSVEVLHIITGNKSCHYTLDTENFIFLLDSRLTTYLSSQEITSIVTKTKGFTWKSLYRAIVGLNEEEKEASFAKLARLLKDKELQSIIGEKSYPFDSSAAVKTMLEVFEIEAFKKVPIETLSEIAEKNVILSKETKIKINEYVIYKKIKNISFGFGDKCEFMFQTYDFTDIDKYGYYSEALFKANRVSPDFRIKMETIISRGRYVKLYSHNVYLLDVIPASETLYLRQNQIDNIMSIVPADDEKISQETQNQIRKILRRR